MPVESAATISTLNAALPADDNPLQQGAAHLRVIKSAVKATFPNVSSPIIPTSAVLNGLPARADALETTRVRNDIAQSIEGPLTVINAVDAASVRQGGAILIPRGIIVSWFGAVASIPGGWLLCDGTNGTPDLREKFAYGAGGATAPLATLGANSVTATSSSAGGHTHTTQTGGAHSHGAATGSTALSEAQMPAHNHPGVTSADGAHTHGLTGGLNQGGGSIAGGDIANAGGGAVQSAGTHNHSVTTESRGGGEGHTHSIASDAGHTHVVDAAAAHTHATTFDNRPASVALCFIMKA